MKTDFLAWLSNIGQNQNGLACLKSSVFTSYFLDLEMLNKNCKHCPIICCINIAFKDVNCGFFFKIKNEETVGKLISMSTP
jgi:hypothetical protein